MPLNIKNPEVEDLASELARLTGTTKTEAIRRSLLETRDRLRAVRPAANREENLRRFLEQRIWPNIPTDHRPWTKDEEDEALGYGEFGEPV